MHPQGSPKRWRRRSAVTPDTQHLSCRTRLPTSTRLSCSPERNVYPYGPAWVALRRVSQTQREPQAVRGPRARVGKPFVGLPCRALATGTPLAPRCGGLEDSKSATQSAPPAHPKLRSDMLAVMTAVPPVAARSYDHATTKRRARACWTTFKGMRAGAGPSTAGDLARRRSTKPLPRAVLTTVAGEQTRATADTRRQTRAVVSVGRPCCRERSSRQ